MYWVNTMVRKLSCIEPTQKFVTAHFALIIIIVVCVVKHQSVINTYKQKAGEPTPENDAGFLKVITIACSQLN